MLAPLVDLEDFIPGLRVELRYATPRNFLGRVLYSSRRALLAEPVAHRLREAEFDARKRGLGLKVWDAFRSRGVQEQIWSLCPNPRFVAPPERGSRHSRGAAVDVTLVQCGDECELPMGTDFDDFGPAAATDHEGLPEAIRVNRRILRELMRQHGFQGIQSEWWHFDAIGWEAFPLRE